jgi:hypothetical protein
MHGDARLSTLAQASENADAAARALEVIRGILKGRLPSKGERNVLLHEADLLDLLTDAHKATPTPHTKMLRERSWSLTDVQSLAALFRAACPSPVENAVMAGSAELRRLATEGRQGASTEMALDVSNYLLSAALDLLATAERQIRPTGSISFA